MSYDVIGDIHGQAGKLAALLERLGYVSTAFGWRPPAGRQAVFVGDLIDRGAGQLEVLHTVRSMIDAGHARCVMGNHEFNAIGWVTPDRDRPGHFLRSHDKPAHAQQHAAFLAQVGVGTPRHREWVDWFRTLPPALDLGGIRVVHAWWHDEHLAAIAAGWPAGSVMGDDFLHAAYRRGRPEWIAMEGLTKGMELPLPAGHSFRDHGGVERTQVRARWWLQAPRSWREIALVDQSQRMSLPDTPPGEAYRPTPHTGSPIFVGHYWMRGRPVRQTAHLACVDWSAARDGPLVAYRWEGEDELRDDRFVASDDSA